MVSLLAWLTTHSPVWLELLCRFDLALARQEHSKSPNHVPAGFAPVTLNDTQPEISHVVFEQLYEHLTFGFGWTSVKGEDEKGDVDASNINKTLRYSFDRPRRPQWYSKTRPWTWQQLVLAHNTTTHFHSKAVTIWPPYFHLRSDDTNSCTLSLSELHSLPRLHYLLLHFSALALVNGV